MPALLADGRGRGIVTALAMQSFSQATARWGKSGAETMRNAASILLVFGGLSVAADLEELSQRGTAMTVDSLVATTTMRACTPLHVTKRRTLNPLECLLRDGVSVWDRHKLDEREHEGVLDFLIQFVADFNGRYGEKEKMRIPACWQHHEPLLEELTTLALARWHAFCSPQATIGGAQYWHSYTLPSSYDRMHFWLGSDALCCGQGPHRSAIRTPAETSTEA